MTYVEFKNRIEARLKKQASGLTWRELKESLELPYDRPCPEWVKRLEAEIGLARMPGAGRALVWKVKSEGRRSLR